MARIRPVTQLRSGSASMTGTSINEIFSTSAALQAQNSSMRGSINSWLSLRGSLLPGIPYPTDPVPSAIMPTLPTGADYDNHEWIGTYDPITYTASWPSNWPSAEQANYYYVDKFDANATDTGNTYGYPDRPRLTIPTTLWSNAGTRYAEIHGNNTSYDLLTNDYTIGGNSIPVAHTGTSSAPVFIKGVDSPWIGINGGSGGSGFQISGLRHVIWDGLYIKNIDGGGGRTWPHMDIQAGTQYFCFRNGAFKGENGADTVNQTGQMINIGGGVGTENYFIVFYNTLLKDVSNWTAANVNNVDAHVFRPAYRNRYVWLVDCEVAHGGGDCIQVGNSNNGSTDQAHPTHYLYIGGNDFYESYENALDCKNSFHIITCKNLIHDFATGQPPTAMLLSNNGEGTYSGWHWSLFDKIYDCDTGLRDDGNHPDETNAVIGCRMWNITGGYAFQKDSSLASTRSSIVNCTVYNVNGNGISDGAVSGTYYTSGNIISTVTGDIAQANGATSTHTYSVRHSFGGVFSGWDTTTGSLEADPLFVDPVNANFSLQASSPAVGIIPTIDPIYDEFESMYGISIKFDAEDRPLPANNLCAGALQRE